MATEGDLSGARRRAARLTPRPLEVPAVLAGGAYLYDGVRNLLERKIASGELPPGALLKEAAVATHLGLSRAPVRRAMAMLAEEGAIRPAEGQGYIVGHGRARRLNARELHDILAPATEDIDRSATWERIFSRVSDEIASLQPFGTYRILEAELGDFHDVSRTVAREVLWRLTDARLIEKDRKSRWIAGQTTARDVRDSFEMRRLLEPRALAHVAPHLCAAWLEALEARVERAIAAFPDCPAAEIDAIEHDMFQTMYERLRNTRMLSSIRRNQVALGAPRIFRQHFPVRDDLPALLAYGQIARLVRTGSVEAAQVLLRTHLERVEPLVLARLRVLAVLPPPAAAPYLIAVH